MENKEEKDHIGYFCLFGQLSSLSISHLHTSTANQEVGSILPPAMEAPKICVIKNFKTLQKHGKEVWAT